MERSFVIKGNICQTKSRGALDLHERAFAVCVDGISRGVFDVIHDLRLDQRSKGQVSEYKADSDSEIHSLLY